MITGIRRPLSSGVLALLKYSEDEPVLSLLQLDFPFNAIVS
jgi:hypothetical protein